MRIEKTQEYKKQVGVNVRFNKIKACLCVFWGIKAIWCSSGCSDRGTSHSADSIELNKKQTVAHFVAAMLWLKSKVQLGWFECDHAVFLKDCHLNQQGLSAEHLTGNSGNRQSQKANEILHNLSSCNTRSINEVVSRAILHKWQLVQLMIDDYKHYCVYTANLTLASQELLNSCAQIRSIWDPEYQKSE